MAFVLSALIGLAVGGLLAAGGKRQHGEWHRGRGCCPSRGI